MLVSQTILSWVITAYVVFQNFGTLADLLYDQKLVRALVLNLAALDAYFSADMAASRVQPL